MSKSESEKGTIYLLEDLKITRKKIMSAVTDSDNEVRYDVINKPGISNLLVIMSELTNRSIEDLEKEYATGGYGNFKKAVADVVCNELEKLQNKVNEIKNSDLIDKILAEGAIKASKIAKETLREVYSKIGLR